jgi:hypothetical protein
MLFQIPGQQGIKVVRGSRPFYDCMSPARICHEVERLSQLDQAIDQQLCALVMDVVVSGAVDKFFRSTVILGNEEFDDCILYP